MGHDEDKNSFDAGAAKPIASQPRTNITGNNRLGMRSGRNISAAQAELDRISADSNPNAVPSTATGDIVLNNPAPKGKKSPKIIILAVLVVLAVVAAVVSVVVIMMNQKSNDIVTQDVVGDMNGSVVFDEKAYIPYMNNDDNYGFYDPSKNEKVLSEKYLSATRFYGDYAAVSYDNGSRVMSAFIDKQGNVKNESEQKDNVPQDSYDIEDNIWTLNGKIYDSKLKEISLPDSYSSLYIGYGYIYNVFQNSSSSATTNNTVVEDDGSAATDSQSVAFTAKLSDKNSEIKYSCNSLCTISISKKDENSYAVIKEWGEKAIIINASNGEKLYTDSSDKGIEIVADGVFKVKGANKYLVASGNSLEETKNYNASADDSISKSNKYYIESCNGGLMKITDGKNEIRGCEIESVAELSKNAYSYYSAKKSSDAVIITVDSKNILYDMKNKKDIKELPEGEVNTHENSFLIDIVNLNGEPKLCNVFLDKDCVSLGNYTTLDVKDTYAVVDNNKKVYTAQLGVI